MSRIVSVEHSTALYVAGKIDLKTFTDDMERLAQTNNIDESVVPGTALWNDPEVWELQRNHCQQGEHLFNGAARCWWCSRLKIYC